MSLMMHVNASQLSTSEFLANVFKERKENIKLNEKEKTKDRINSIRKHFLTIAKSESPSINRYEVMRDVEALEAALECIDQCMKRQNADFVSEQRATYYDEELGCYKLKSNCKMTEIDLINRVGLLEEKLANSPVKEKVYKVSNPFDRYIKNESLKLPKGLQTTFMELAQADEISIRVAKSITRAGVQYVGDLENISLEKIKRFRNFGEKSIEQIINLADRCGIIIGKNCM